MPEPAKRACDACHRRKVKCVSDGGQICLNCKSAQLSCTYNAVPQKKGPKGSRAKVISELRESQRQTPLTPWTRDRLDMGSPPPGSPASSRGGRNLQPELISACVEFFFANMYPTQPILGRDRLQQTIAGMQQSVDLYCLVYALCAYMLIQPNMQIPPGYNFDVEEVSSPMALGHALLAEAVEVRKGANIVESPSLESVTTSFFLFGCYFNLESANKAYFYLREATTFALLIGMQDEKTYQMSGDLGEATLKRRLFWLLFVTERAYALQAQRPLTLHATIALPQEIESGPEAVELTGFMHLIRLFRPFDDTFVGLWNQSIEGCDVEWIINLQRQLSDALPKYLRCTETQAVDLRTSQQWLRIMVWQLSISNRLLSSAATDEAMTFRYPVELSRELASVAASFSQSSMEVHGIGLVKKLFDVACTLVDVMTYVPMDGSSFELGPRDYLNNFLQIISKLRGGQTRYLPILLAKTSDAIPGMSDPVPRVLRLPSSVGGQFVELPERPVTTTAQGHGDPRRSFRPPMTLAEPIKTDYAQVYAGNSPYSSARSAQSPYDGVAPGVDPFASSSQDYH